MTIERRKSIIEAILSQLNSTSKTEKKAFDYGDTFLHLVFKSDSELLRIAKLCRVS